MKMVIFGDPIPKTRHRCGCHGKFPVAFDPQIKKEMEPVRQQMLHLWNSAFDNPESAMAQEAHLLAQGDTFFVTMQFYMPINKSCTVSQRNMKLWGITPCNEKPDFDNLAKFYADCLTGIVFPDDKLIVCGIAHKVRYSLTPRTEIDIMAKKDLTLEENQLQVFKVFSPQDLKDFIIGAQELGMMYGCNRALFEDNQQVPQEPFFKEASLAMMKFANRFGAKLKKIANLED